MRSLNFTDFLGAALCIIIAISLQIQITLFQSPDYLGLRINLTDLLIVPAGIAILVTLLRKQSLCPSWHIKHIYCWLLALTAVLALSVIHTHFTFGEISRWAFINKFGGWFILVAIMSMGAWIATNASQKHIELFLKTFLYFSFAILLCEQLKMIAQFYEWIPDWLGGNPTAAEPIAGLMANRNAYGLLFVTTLCLANASLHSKTPIIRPALTYALYALLPLFLVLNGSRTTFITCCLLVLLMALCHLAQWKTILRLTLTLAIGAGFAFAIYQDNRHQFLVLTTEQLEFVKMPQQDENPSAKINYSGDTMRLTILNDAKEMIHAHPVLGSGLGSMLIYQEQKYGKIINLIDCTALWILVEMGLIGLAAFAAFYIQSTRALIITSKSDEGLSKTIRQSLLFILIGFTIMSLFHEIMYTRFIWFFLGLGLTLPSRMRRDV